MAPNDFDGSCDNIDELAYCQMCSSMGRAIYGPHRQWHGGGAAAGGNNISEATPDWART